MAPEKLFGQSKSLYKIEERTTESMPIILNSPTSIVISILTWSLWCLYIGLQLTITYSITEVGVWRIWIAILAEVFLTLQEGYHAIEMLLSLMFRKRLKERPQYRLIGDLAPSVDICITCCGESKDVIMDTVAAAASQDYPTQSYQVSLLDDGEDDELRSAFETFKESTAKARQEGPPLFYLRRKKELGIPSFYKAGNLNFGLEQIRLRGQPSEYFAALDADMIAEHDWLRRVVPHLILHDDIALACPPQVRSIPAPARHY